MNKEDIINELKKLQDERDYEESHMAADDLLCKLLNDLGHSDVVDEYHKINKWFA